MEMVGWFGRVAAKVYRQLGFIPEIKFPASKETNQRTRCFAFFFTALTFDPITFGAEMGREANKDTVTAARSLWHCAEV